MTQAQAAVPQIRHRSALKVGMPHLGFIGLSENWLLQHLGHVHWGLIEEATDQQSTNWCDAAGSRLYASFVALELSGDLLAEAREGSVVCLEAHLERLGPGLYLSEHELTVAGCSLAARAQLCTTFVRRTRIGDNHSFEKAIDGPTVSRGPTPTRRRTPLLDAYRHGRMNLPRPTEIGQVFPVAPPEDFNGAGMVYFANYIRFVDRADWSFATHAGMPWRVYRRRLFYYGNLNISDSVKVEHIERRAGYSRTRLSRAGADDAVAYCETERR